MIANAPIDQIGPNLAKPGHFSPANPRGREYVQILSELAMEAGGVVRPTETVTDCADHEDNRILECAAAGESILIVSDDAHLLEVSRWRGIPVATSRDFVSRTDVARRKGK